jgi:hypothetical protein
VDSPAFLATGPRAAVEGKGAPADAGQAAIADAIAATAPGQIRDRRAQLEDHLYCPFPQLIGMASGCHKPDLPRDHIHQEIRGSPDPEANLVWMGVTVMDFAGWGRGTTFGLSEDYVPHGLAGVIHVFDGSVVRAAACGIDRATTSGSGLGPGMVTSASARGRGGRKWVVPLAATAAVAAAACVPVVWSLLLAAGTGGGAAAVGVALSQIGGVGSGLLSETVILAWDRPRSRRQPDALQADLRDALAAELEAALTLGTPAAAALRDEVAGVLQGVQRRIRRVWLGPR